MVQGVPTINDPRQSAPEAPETTAAFERLRELVAQGNGVTKMEKGDIRRCPQCKRLQFLISRHLPDKPDDVWLHVVNESSHCPDGTPVIARSPSVSPADWWPE